MTNKTQQFWNSEASIHKTKAYGYGTNPNVRYPTYEVRRERVLELLADVPRGKLLDCGCGTADVLVELMQRQGWDGHGIDYAPNMADKARDTLESAGYGRERIHTGSIVDLSAFADNSCQVVICMGVLGYLPAEEQPLVYAEVRRVLKDDGIFLLQLVNGLFDLYTMNRYTVDFCRNNLLSEFFDGEALDEAARLVAGLLARPDAPETNSKYGSARDYVPWTTEIPIAFAEKAAGLGFRQVDQVFTRLHSLPPLVFESRPELEKLAIEHEKRLCRHWSANFLAAGFISVLKKA